MAKIIKTGMTVKEARELDNLRAETEKQKALIDYIAIMADVEIPEDEENNYDE